ncbi:hypothetical protein F4677DRAFT_316116 [Hypoxylon crocopeplum]|nr:hypothetical protein F4677DRAFT_316116 [Hypoxylon crocopeplum]
MSSLPKSWECAFPGCGKKFTRKEHLNRHNLIHNPEHQYKCHVCGRRYARSDVYKRHLKQHNIEPPEGRTKRKELQPRTCLPCGERNSRCDGNSPCGACMSNWTDCRWNGPDNSHESGSIEQPAVMPPITHSQAAWFPPTPEGWTSQSFPSSPLLSSVPSDLNSGHQGQDGMEPAGYVLLGSNTSADYIPNDISNCPKRTPQTTSPLTPHQRNGLADLQTGFDRNSAETKRLVGLFFSDIHPHWPMLHAPTFEAEKAPTILLAPMVMLASWLEGGSEHQKLSPLVFEEVNRIRMDLNPPLCLLQAVLLYIVYTTYTLTTEGMVAKALNLTSLLISTCRYLGIFSGQYTCQERTDQECECPFVAWRIQEQLNRLAFFVLRVDTYLSVLLDHPPSLRYQELCIPLPKSRELWAASNDDERRKLQWNEPAGREKALFSFLMRDALHHVHDAKLPYRLTDIDYHLTTCATQTCIWEAAREAHSSMSDELVDETDPATFVELAHPYLTLWQDRRKDCTVQTMYFSGNLACLDGDEHCLAPHTFTLMYISTLKLHAPLNTLRARGHYYKARPGAAMPTRKPRAHLRSWITSGCPRSALWNAAQLCRIYTIERARSESSPRRTPLRLNPLLTPGVLMSAIVACSFAWYTPTCRDCCGDEHEAWSGEAVDLFDAADDDPALDAWRQQGVGVPYWGGGGGEKILVCRCKLTDIAAWFRQAFAEDERAEMEFVLFLAELSRESQEVSS